MTTTLASRGSALADRVRTRGGWRTAALLMFVGMFVMQVAWMCTVSPFRGSDEFDHAYKAAAVARGEIFVDPSTATRGTGAWLDVPADIVEAARPQCQFLHYTSDADCVGTARPDGSVRIASGAGRYHPLYYAVVGTAALPFDGLTALYAMRLATVLVCIALFAGSLLALRTWAQTAWPYVAVVVAAVPVLVYSTSIAAPNGVEMMAGLLLWSSLLGLLKAPPERLGRLLPLATTGACVLVTTRSLGPVWCLLTLVCVLFYDQPSSERLRAIVRRPLTWWCVGVFGVVALQSVLWITSMGSLDLGAAEGTWTTGEKLSNVAHRLVLWPLQTVAAIPLRDENSAPVVYAFAFLLLGTLLVLALRRAVARERWAIVLAILVTLLAPAAIVWNTLGTFGDVWQGRYGLPFAVGIPLLAGASLERGRRPFAVLAPVAAGLFCVAQVVALVTVLRRELRMDVLVHSGEWTPAPTWFLGALIGAGALTLCWGAWMTGRPAQETTRD